MPDMTQLSWFSKGLIEVLPAAVYVCDTEAVIVAFNQRATELWGRTPAVGQTDEKYCGSHKLFRSDGTHLPHPETPMGMVLRTGQPASNEEVIIERPDGSRVTVLVNIAPLFDESGLQIGAVNCFQDLSAQKHSEKERELLRDELHQAQKMEVVGHLTGGLAHDFNNLLAGISGSFELLHARLKQGRVSDLERYISTGLEASKRAAALTHRLLAFSRRQPLDAKPTDIGSLIVGMEELVRRTVGPGIALEVITPVGLWTAFVDPNQLENALLNLCINARDAMPNGGKLLVEAANISFDERMAGERDLPPGQYVSLSVSDNGAGMSPDVAAKAFEPFYTTKTVGMGTGLGLAMIHGFVRQSGGQVRIYSELGSGTIVRVYLPRSLSDLDALEALPKVAETPHATVGETVLVVDDEATLRMLVIDVLEDLGYIAIEAADGVAALRVVQSDARVDLLITDIGLTGRMNGRLLAEAARECRHDLKVLFITGYSENTLLRHGHLGPNMNVMTKPFAVDELAHRIRELIALD